MEVDDDQLSQAILLSLRDNYRDDERYQNEDGEIHALRTGILLAEYCPKIMKITFLMSFFLEFLVSISIKFPNTNE